MLTLSRECLTADFMFIHPGTVRTIAVNGGLSQIKSKGSKNFACRGIALTPRRMKHFEAAGAHMDVSLYSTYSHPILTYIFSSNPAGRKGLLGIRWR